MSNSDDEPSLSEILDTLDDAGDEDHVTINQILEGFGDRSLAPILLVPAMITATPISGIPGVPTITGLIVGLIVVQMLMGRDTLWVPRAVGKRGVSKEKMEKSVSFLRKPVGWLDRVMKPRISWLAKRPWNYAALLTCLAIAVTTPLMELLPFVISLAAVAIGVFAAGILMRDGVVMLIGYALTAVLVFASVQVA